MIDNAFEEILRDKGIFDFEMLDLQERFIPTSLNPDGTRQCPGMPEYNPLGTEGSGRTLAKCLEDATTAQPAVEPLPFIGFVPHPNRQIGSGYTTSGRVDAVIGPAAVEGGKLTMQVDCRGVSPRGEVLLAQWDVSIFREATRCRLDC